MVQVEVYLQLAVALVVEVVADGAMEGRLAELLGIEHLIPEWQRFMFSKSQVIKRHQHRHLPSLASILSSTRSAVQRFAVNDGYRLVRSCPAGTEVR